MLKGLWLWKKMPLFLGNTWWTIQVCKARRLKMTRRWLAQAPNARLEMGKQATKSFTQKTKLEI